MFRALLLLIVAAPLLQAQTAWRLDPQPTVRIAATTADGTLQFATAMWATRMPSGEIVIADGTDATLRIAGANGRVTRSLGRKGQGPGEFTMLTWVGACGGDTLYAWDMATTRVSVFHAVNGFARQFEVPVGNGWSAACSADGQVAVMSRPDRQGPAPADFSGTTATGGTYEVRRMTANLLRVNADGSDLAAIPGVVWGEFIAGRMGRGMAALPRPLGATSVYAFAGDRLVVASTDSGRVTVYDHSGTLAASFVVPAVKGAPSAAQYERALAPSIAMVPPSRHEMLIAFAKSVPLPERLPALSRVFADSAGIIWVVNSPDGDPVTRLTAHQATGQVVGTLEIPFAIALFEVGTDYVLGRTENADGEQEVVSYRFRR